MNSLNKLKRFSKPRTLQAVEALLLRLDRISLVVEPQDTLSVLLTLASNGGECRVRDGYIASGARGYDRKAIYRGEAESYKSDLSSAHPGSGIGAYLRSSPNPMSRSIGDYSFRSEDTPTALSSCIGLNYALPDLVCRW